MQGYVLSGTRLEASLPTAPSLPSFLPCLPIKATATAGNKARRKSCRTIVVKGWRRSGSLRVRVIKEGRVRFYCGEQPRGPLPAMLARWLAVVVVLVEASNPWSCGGVAWRGGEQAE